METTIRKEHSVDHGRIKVNDDSRVTLYAAPDCSWCQATEAMLSGLGIAYERVAIEGPEKHIGHDEHTSSPPVSIDEQFAAGYQDVIAL
jgi:glutaredoxin